jgi:hypothetical protein
MKILALLPRFNSLPSWLPATAYSVLFPNRAVVSQYFDELVLDAITLEEVASNLSV